MKYISEILRLNPSKQSHMERLQQELHKIPYIAHRCEDAKELGIDVDFRILEAVLDRLRANDLAISFIMSDNGYYEMILLGIGKWKLPDKNGNFQLYRVIGETAYCKSLYECVAKAVVCLYRFIQINKRE